MIRKAKTVGLSIGMGGFFQEPYYNFVSGPTRITFGPHTNYDNEIPKQTPPNVREVGYHKIYNCLFDSCGQAGIVGLGHFGNIIYGNRFSNIPCLDNNRSWEDGAIKFHMSCGTIIERNLFEGYPRSAWTIWLDAAALCHRITRNVFYGHPAKKFSAIYVEITSARPHWMNIIDNNLFLDCNSGIGGARADGVGIYHNLFYSCDFAFSMGSQREGCVNTDRCGCGAMRNYAISNLLIDNTANYGLAFPPRETKVAADYNILIPPGGHFQLCDSGTGNAAFCGGIQYTCAQIDAYYKSIGRPGSYWKGSETLWLVADSFGPLGCESDFAAWRAMMDSIDAHTVERNKDAFTINKRQLTIDLKDDPGIGAPQIAGINFDFLGNPIGPSPKAGPMQDLDANSRTYIFWNDALLPSVPSPPEAPSYFSATSISPSVNKLKWVVGSDAIFIQIERRVSNGPWEMWGIAVAAVDSIVDDQLTDAASFSYRIAAMNSGGISPPIAASLTRFSPPNVLAAGQRGIRFLCNKKQGTLLRLNGSTFLHLTAFSLAGSVIHPLPQDQKNDPNTIRFPSMRGIYIIGIKDKTNVLWQRLIVP